VIFAVPLSVRAAGPSPAAPPPWGSIKPLLQQHCVKCHGPDKKKGDVDLSAALGAADEKSAARHRKLWRNALAQVETLEMPPAKEKPLSAPEREALTAWLRHAATTVDCSDPSDRDPGPALVRRLTRAEYDRTIRDLVGIEFDAGAAVGMPDDAQTHGFSNQATALILPPVLMEKYFAAADQIVEQLLLPADEKAAAFTKLPSERRKALKGARAAVFFTAPGDGGASKRDAARRIVERLAPRAYRRPVRPDEVDRLLRPFDKLDAAGASFDQAVGLSLKAVLVSPNFLLRVERDRPGAHPPRRYRADDHELATRLSYFLWSTMPDAELFDLAARGALADPDTLDRQVRRMLADPKARALTDQFAAQWLQLDKLADARPSTEFFPTFKPALRQAMRDETAWFFDHLRTADRPVLDLLDADYTFLNADLAKHYGVPGVDGKELRKVALPKSANRGGLLGMASVLSLTSHTSRTSPTLRGKYVLDVIFGTPPPPPPPDAGMLKEEKAKPGKEPKTFREQMAQHAADAACASCHKRIDPLGYGLENFDAIGRWRADAGGGRALDSSGQLPTGESFTGPAQLKQVILARKPQFVRNVAEQALTYALGRELQYYDECAVQEIVDRLSQDDYRFSALILGVVNSHPFQYRKNAEPTE
jgi:cytochrome c553